MSLTNNVDLKKFFKRFLIFALILILIDFTTGKTLKHFYYNQTSGLLYCTTYSIDSTKADLLIFGSSKANHDYVPSILAKKLNTSVYNCGREGHSLIYYMAVLSAALERYTPKQVIIDLKPEEFSLSEVDQLSSLLPYYQNPGVAKYIKYQGPYEKYKLLSKMYPYNSLLTTIISNSLPSGKLLHPDDRGYVNYVKNVMTYRQKTVFTHGTIYQYRVAILDDMLNMLNKRNIKVRLVFSPSYYIFKDNDPTVTIVESLSRKYNNITFLNYNNNPAFSSNDLYDDERHLNPAGAAKFSEDISDRFLVK